MQSRSRLIRNFLSRPLNACLDLLHYPIYHDIKSCHTLIMQNCWIYDCRDGSRYHERQLLSDILEKRIFILWLQFWFIFTLYSLVSTKHQNCWAFHFIAQSFSVYQIELEIALLTGMDRYILAFTALVFGC